LLESRWVDEMKRLTNYSACTSLTNRSFSNLENK